MIRAFQLKKEKKQTFKVVKPNKGSNAFGSSAVWE